MKRQLTLFALSACLAAPLMAQDPYYPAYKADNNSRQFNFNPGNMMNSMGNPMRDVFGSSNRVYDDYPAGGYVPPGYAPGYGYPAYPAYQQPYTDYGYLPQQAPAYPAYPSPYTYPGAEPVAPAAVPQPGQPPERAMTTPTATRYQSATGEANRNARYRFRPFDEAGGAADSAPMTQRYAPAPVEQPVATMPATVQGTPEPLAPLTYPQDPVMPEPLAPLTYPDSGTAPASPAPVSTARDASLMQPPADLKFRPLDQPGYSSELDQ